jgi:hypothetical protein
LYRDEIKRESVDSSIQVGISGPTVSVKWRERVVLTKCSNVFAGWKVVPRPRAVSIPGKNPTVQSEFG